jgi:hypothetical protein
LQQNSAHIHEMSPKLKIRLLHQKEFPLCFL